MYPKEKCVKDKAIQGFILKSCHSFGDVFFTSEDIESVWSIKFMLWLPYQCVSMRRKSNITNNHLQVWPHTAWLPFT